MTTGDTQKPGCLGLIIRKLRGLLGRPSKALVGLPYRLRDGFLSPAELSYYKVLTSVLGPKATVCAKVRLADILFVPRPSENIGFFNRIAQRHVDFVLCESSNMKPVLAIELDDASHSRPARSERDIFMDEALHAAGLPILRVTPRRQYSREEVIAQLRPFLSGPPRVDKSPTAESRVEAFPTPSASSEDAPPTCPKCGVPMIIRIASRGEHKGSRFYGCPNYPNCRQVLPASEERLAR
ncbi:MAG: DUF2726 domain-containing protein [Anaerolineales bacterium]